MAVGVAVAVAVSVGVAVTVGEGTGVLVGVFAGTGVSKGDATLCPCARVGAGCAATVAG